SSTPSVSKGTVRSTPALLTSTSRGPQPATASCTARAASRASATSRASGQAPVTAAATRSAASRRMSATTTRAPAAPSARHSASPSPPPPPVTSATRPASAPVAAPGEASVSAFISGRPWPGRAQRLPFRRVPQRARQAGGDVGAGDMRLDQLAQEMDGDSVDLLDPLRIRRGHRDGDVHQPVGEAAITPEQADGTHGATPRRLQRAEHVRRLTAGAEHDEHVAGPSERLHLTSEYVLVARIVG